ncbi:sigma-70 family RNA polymerase sigma factor [Pyxidicoccus parkwayensis]|uniref:Sigma-70 family RNA polymerase sigma factor n=1 Tax=Pyxidicoccus parkwayensis TaxID=2813578 RepID=A0ABX7NWZ3_9BACT|nr:sigma-70 family RNA polymerase sigma factor [Pyxidicoccus parkwaysis]QSQ23315.1 sigma-70 family RNA polymerase sigma factor [Pyxidicoccus parkwaysis]
MSISRETFWNVWQCHSEYLYGQSLCLMNGNRADADDAFSTAMLRACESVHRQGLQVTNEKAWLGAVLRNVCIDAHRGRRRIRDDSNEDEDELMDRLSTLESPTLSPETHLLRDELESRLWEHVQALPVTLREPFVMRFLHDMSYCDIAQRLGLTNCNVRKRIQLAYRALRDVLGDLKPEARAKKRGIHKPRTGAF